MIMTPETGPDVPGYVEEETESDEEEMKSESEESS